MFRDRVRAKFSSRKGKNKLIKKKTCLAPVRAAGLCVALRSILY